jgi:hypothetical protein
LKHQVADSTIVTQMRMYRIVLCRCDASTWQFKKIALNGYLCQIFDTKSLFSK